MDWLDKLNSFASTEKASESGFHPVGQFPATIADILQKTTKDGDKYYDIKLKTSHGTTIYRLFDIGPKEIQKAEFDNEFFEKLRKRVGGIKRVFIDLGIATAEQVQSWKWHDPHNPGVSVIGNLGHLIGRECTASVSPMLNDPSKTMTFINAPQPQRSSSLAPQPLQANRALSGNQVPPSSPFGAPSNQSYSVPTPPPSMRPNLDNLPF